MGEETGQTCQAQTYSEGLLENLNHISGEAGDIESEWSCSMLPLSRRLIGTVVVRLLVPVVAAILKPLVDTGCKGCCQAEEEVLSGLPISPEAAARYREAKRNVALAVTEAKTQA